MLSLQLIEEKIVIRVGKVFVLDYHLFYMVNRSEKIRKPCAKTLSFADHRCSYKLLFGSYSVPIGFRLDQLVINILILII